MDWDSGFVQLCDVFVARKIVEVMKSFFFFQNVLHADVVPFFRKPY